MTKEEIIKKHAPDWNNWHQQCREQVLKAMEEYKNREVHLIESKYLNKIYD